MATQLELRVPAQGDGIESCLLAEWLVEVGEDVAEGNPVYAVETVKGIFEIDSPATGRLIERRTKAGEEVPIQFIVGILEIQ
jgi:pyruvate dehydrogenase E2 component (dihydrolipoamide acetyltransferase)